MPKRGIKCPFCGKHNVWAHQLKAEGGGYWYECHSCSASGPIEETKLASLGTWRSIKVWNKKTKKEEL